MKSFSERLSRKFKEETALFLKEYLEAKGLDKIDASKPVDESLVFEADKILQNIDVMLAEDS